MKRNTPIFIALAVFFVIVALGALTLLSKDGSVFNRSHADYGTEPAVLTQTVIGEEPKETVPAVTEPEPAPEPEPEPEAVEVEEEAEEPEPEPVFEIRYFTLETNNSTTILRLREAPSEEAEIIKKMYPGSHGIVLQPGNEWCHVRMNSGLEGYCATEFLTLTEVTEEAYPAEYADRVEAPVEELNVPAFTTLLIDKTSEEAQEDALMGETGTAEEAPADVAAADTVPATETTPAEPAAEATPAAEVTQ